jgi:TPR repeat protein
MNQYIAALVICIFMQKLALADDQLFTYELTSSNEATITGCYKKCPPSIKIPDKIDGYTITGVGVKAFSEAGLTSVTLNESVLRIEREAFHFNYLTNVTLPSNLEVIGEAAFSQNQLQIITIPASVRTVSRKAFIYNSLHDVVMFEGTNVIDQSAFALNQLKNLSLPESIVEIGEGAFSSNQLKRVSIPKNVKIVGRHAFSKNPLAQVRIQNRDTQIEFAAFPQELTIIAVAPSENSEALGYEKKNYEMYDAILAKAEGRYVDAFVIFEALSRKSPDAAFHLAHMYQYGQGVNEDIALAVKGYEEAIKSTDKKLVREAAERIGYIHLDGAEYFPPDQDKALFWLAKAANLGSISSATKLSKLYLDQDGRHFNVREGIKYLELNASRGDLYSLQTLAMLYWDGDKVNQNHAMALELLLKASDMGHAPSRYNIGVLYSDGEAGVPDNLTEAFMWFIIASVTGYENAAGAIMQLKPNMTTMQIRKAQDDASRCAEYDYVGC